MTLNYILLRNAFFGLIVGTLSFELFDHNASMMMWGWDCVVAGLIGLLMTLQRRKVQREAEAKDKNENREA